MACVATGPSGDHPLLAVLPTDWAPTARALAQDRARAAALVQDLHDRGLQDDVTVVVWGEFGRTPKINKSAGRDHWSKVACGLLAGGGMQGGQVIGTTNRYAEEPIDRPVHFQEVFATLYQNLGIDPTRTTLTDLTGRPRYLMDDFRPLPEVR